MAYEDTINFDSTLRGLVPGQRFTERYELIRELGRGAMGVVWLARDHQMHGDEVALKVLPEHFSRDERAARDLINEARLAMRLSHPGIMRLHNCDRTPDGTLFLVMEYLPGPTLKAFLWERIKRRNGKSGPLLSEAEFYGLVRQVAEALEAAHAERVIHRDLKPANLIFKSPIPDPSGPLDFSSIRIKICDFGIARLLDDARTHLTGTPMAGTLAYMSPEQIKGQGIGPASDIYALGCILHETMSGEPPFRTGDLSYQHLNIPPPPLNGCPPGVEATIRKCLEKQPGQRFGSARELLASESGGALPTTPLLGRFFPGPLAFGSLLLGIGALSLYLLGDVVRGDSSDPALGTERQIDSVRQDTAPAVTAVSGALEADPIVDDRLALDRREDEAESTAESPPAALVPRDTPSLTPQSASTPSPSLTSTPTPEKARPPAQMAGSTPTVRPTSTHQFPPQYRDYTESAKGLGMEMVWIEGGSFMMGSPPGEEGRDDDEGPQHRVELDGFWLGKYEVTQDQWRTVMGSNPSRFRGGRLPVEKVSWNEAMEFCRELSQMTGKTYTLPTEAQWEYACRARTNTAFSTGRTITTDQANFDGDYTYGGRRKGIDRKKTVEVGTFAPNPWGLHDMHGNVYEWCRDWYDREYYMKRPGRNPNGPVSGDQRVLRGGSWHSIPASVRAAYRYGLGPEACGSALGFRVARTPD